MTNKRLFITGAIAAAMFSTSALANSTIEAKQSLITTQNVLTSQFYVNELNDNAGAKSINTIRENGLITTKNVLSSNYLISTLPEDQKTQVIELNFEDEADATVTETNVLSSQYRASFSPGKK